MKSASLTGTGPSCDNSAFILGSSSSFISFIILSSLSSVICSKPGISFFTGSEKECRAWTIRSGYTAQKAAGTIHTDMDKGFIRAEVVGYDTLIKEGSLNNCKDKGLLRLEGKEYIVQDGDIISIRFNV